MSRLLTQNCLYVHYDFDGRYDTSIPLHTVSTSRDLSFSAHSQLPHRLDLPSGLELRITRKLIDIERSHVSPSTRACARNKTVDLILHYTHFPLSIRENSIAKLHPPCASADEVKERGIF